MKVGLIYRLSYRIRVGELPRVRQGQARKRARLALCLFPLFLFILVLSTWLVADSVRPAATDPDYATRRELLRTRQKEVPDAQLLIVLGGSRTALGFVPESLPPTTTSNGKPMLWFNFSHHGAGPVFEFVLLNRLLRDGVRPTVAVIEVMPSFVAREREDFLGHFLSAAEIAEVAGYVRSERLMWYALRHRFAKPDQWKRAAFGPETVPAGSHGGPTNLLDSITAAERASRLETQRSFHDRTIRNITFPAGGDAAIRKLLATCRANGITPVLLLAPEGPVFQSFYNADGWLLFQSHLERLAEENGVRLINARNWLTEDQFYDSHHPLRHGAESFTRRLIQELSPELAKLQ